MLPTVQLTLFLRGSSGQPNLHGKIPTGSPWAAHSVAQEQPIGSSHVFGMGMPLSYDSHLYISLKPRVSLGCKTSYLLQDSAIG